MCMKYISKSPFQKGFTLIELLVVVAIIGILASVILASLTGAKNKAKDSSVKNSLVEFQKLLELEYDASGNYYALQPNVWFAVPATCDGSFTGTYAAQAASICKNILTNSSDWFGSNRFFAGTSTNTGQTYSVMATINTGAFFCIGSNGNSAIDAGVSFSSLGCWANP